MKPKKSAHQAAERRLSRDDLPGSEGDREAVGKSRPSRVRAAVSVGKAGPPPETSVDDGVAPVAPPAADAGSWKTGSGYAGWP